ncbi:MAG: radical SAM protein [Clostridia bacterium]|nr:radical SAM protein [Clostridia bacterium]
MNHPELQSYMSAGIDRIVSNAKKAALKNPKESLFLFRFAFSCRSAAKKRKASEEKGEHIPPFLIASITSRCNLHCAGCYSRCTNATVDEAPVSQLIDKEWGRIFKEASSLGISFILLAGGEPMLRWDVIKEASKIKKIIFPIFTNGTIMGEEHFKLLDGNRNLLPIISIEGSRTATDSRRGEGVYDKLGGTMEQLNKKGILFGASITITSDNINEVTSSEFLDGLAGKGCSVVVFVEYVPIDGKSENIALGEAEKEYLKERVNALRKQKEDMVYISFPGDEEYVGGCVAAGRGFFHINSHGGAEPCPFSPYSDINLKNSSLKEALSSKLFERLRLEGLLSQPHKGGCVLYDKKSEIEALIENK